MCRQVGLTLGAHIMNRQEAWKIVADGCPDYEGEELIECRDFLLQYWAARKVVAATCNRKWWELWK